MNDPDKINIDSVMFLDVGGFDSPYDSIEVLLFLIESTSHPSSSTKEYVYEIF